MKMGLNYNVAFSVRAFEVLFECGFIKSEVVTSKFKSFSIDKNDNAYLIKYFSF
jgi:hypothetical protein